MTEPTGLLVADGSRQRKKILHHMKCLFWCLNQMQTRYDLNLVLYSLEHRNVHPEIRDSNLGDNVSYLIENFESEDLNRLAEAMRHLPDSVGQIESGDKQFILGHYVQANEDFGPIPSGSYGVIASLSPAMHGLFLIEGGHLFESPFTPDQVGVIYGTYIV